VTKLSIFGICLTLLYLLGVFSIFSSNWGDFASLRPNEWGDFLAGAFGPLAIFWLVLGFFQQGHELRHSVKALELQADELKNSVEQHKAMVRITEKQLNLDIEVRDKEKVVAAERDLPFFQLSEIHSTDLPTISIIKTKVYKMTNFGSHATNVSLSLGRSGSNIDPGSFASFPHNETREIRITTGTYSAESGALVITSSNHKQQERRQEFGIGMSGPRMLTCFPEQK
jgi:hypothetical protein